MEILLIILILCVIAFTISVSYFLLYSLKVFKTIMKYCDAKNDEILAKMVELYKDMVNTFIKPNIDRKE